MGNAWFFMSCQPNWYLPHMHYVRCMPFVLADCSRCQICAFVVCNEATRFSVVSGLKLHRYFSYSFACSTQCNGQKNFLKMKCIQPAIVVHVLRCKLVFWHAWYHAFFLFIQYALDNCDWILENHPYYHAWSNWNFWLYHSAADATKSFSNISKIFLVILGHFDLLNT